LQKDMYMRNLLILMTGAVILTGCFQTQEAALGPDETLNAFYRSICSGDFDNAESLCDTLTMQEYVGDLRKEWTKADSSVMTIVPAILSEVTVSITDIVKNGQERTLFYELTATDGSIKEKVATLKKEEGAWKIEEITDRH